MGVKAIGRRRFVLSMGGSLVLATGARPAKAQQTTLVIANSQWMDALRGKTLWEAVLKYQAVAPNVVLQQEAIPSADFDNKITTEFGAGQGPDIAIMQEGLFYTIADAGFLIDISPALAGAHGLNDTNANGVVGGKRLGIAWQRAVYALIYNKPLLDQAGAKVPENIDELIAAARAVSGATGAIGFSARHQMADFTGWFMDFQNWAYGYGVNWTDAKGRLTVATPEAVTSVVAFKKMFDAKIIPLGDDFPTQRTRFKQKQVGLSIDNSGGTLNIASGGPLAGRDLYATKLPFPHPGAHQQLFLGVNVRGRNQAAAIDFLAWLVSTDGQQALRNASGPDALATDVPVTAAFQAANPWAQTFATLATHSRSTLIPGHETDTGPIMRFVMQAVEKVIYAGADPTASLAEAQRQVDQNF